MARPFFWLERPTKGIAAHAASSCQSTSSQTNDRIVLPRRPPNARAFLVRSVFSYTTICMTCAQSGVGSKLPEVRFIAYANPCLERFRTQFHPKDIASATRQAQVGPKRHGWALPSGCAVTQTCGSGLGSNQGIVAGSAAPEALHGRSGYKLSQQCTMRLRGSSTHASTYVNSAGTRVHTFSDVER